MDRLLAIKEHWAFRLRAERDGVAWHLFATARAAARRPALLAVQAALAGAGYDDEPEVVWSGPLADLRVDAVTNAALGADGPVTLGAADLAVLADAARDTPLAPCPIARVTLLDAQVGIHPRKHVPDDLAELAFAGPLPCYALIDGAALPQAVDTLASSGLHHTCLFKGGAAEAYGDTAPYLVRLHPDADLTRRLFTYIPDDKLGRGLWDSGCATFLRSPASLEALAGHFRKFTRLIEPNSGKPIFFRFYAPDTMRTVIGHMAQADREVFAHGIDSLFCTDGRGGIWAMSR